MLPRNAKIEHGSVSTHSGVRTRIDSNYVFAIKIKLCVPLQFRVRSFGINPE